MARNTPTRSEPPLDVASDPSGSDHLDPPAGGLTKSAPTPLRADPLTATPRRWSLRARLIALVLATAALALAAVDIVLPMNLRASLLDSRENTLRSVLSTLPQGANGTFGPDQLIESSKQSSLRGEIGWTLVRPSGVNQSFSPAAGDLQANPDFGDQPPLGSAEVVGDDDRPGVNYLALGVQASVVGDDATYYLVAWSPIADITGTVKRLVALELLITAGLLLLLGGISSLIIRRELKPLEGMARTADAIAGGDLDRRVDVIDPSTEVGRLGAAFNGMVDGVGGLLEDRRRSEERLRQFVADASHELRTPVAAVRGYSDLYAAGALPDEAAVDKAMGRIGFEGRRMGALVEDLLTLIQADAERATRFERVDLSELLTGVADDAAVIDPTRTWRLAGTGTRSLVVGDRMRLHQLFANLLANVRTHTPAGTTVTVSVLVSARDVAVTVSDNGPGVSDEALPKLFDRFYRVEASRSRENGGTGLGLSIVAAIVRSHGGEVTASHTPGGGLTMTVILPGATGTAAVPPVGAEPVTGPITGPIGIVPGSAPTPVGAAGPVGGERDVSGT
ncbi:HAMP domain-containing histidine kinase [Nakamurella flavida]|uniref:histidine kinase n=1 Tax=Nakamurella flavida TaxID=363630 RepID=A0A938YLS8_9ACTN|nr:HAMP domain-containing sensor histidine kinase [Nakamurella flavida]MBM9476891.1 HAMP domain-containing histidine kinase [Nakamurella flavida]MDP9779835.1 two-component system OmpR family sensor kinase [Nakamurella flavida]